MLARLPLGGSIAVLVAAALGSGCARAHAKAPSDAPPLIVPVAPPHEVEPIDQQPTPPDIPLPNPPRQTPPRPAPPPQPRPERVEPPRPETKPEPEPPKPEEAPKPAPPATTLQTTPAGAEGEVEKSIRVLLSRASDDLNRVDYRRLNTDARTQYDTAKRFIRQAEDAMRARNFVFAKNLADKAAALAAQLGGR